MHFKVWYCPPSPFPFPLPPPPFFPLLPHFPLCAVNILNLCDPHIELQILINDTCHNFFSVGSDDTLYLLATCYYQAKSPKRAYSLLQSKGCPTAQCRFLFAKCCFELNKWADETFKSSPSSSLPPQLPPFSFISPTSFNAFCKVLLWIEQVSR